MEPRTQNAYFVNSGIGKLFTDLQANVIVLETALRVVSQMLYWTNRFSLPTLMDCVMIPMQSLFDVSLLEKHLATTFEEAITIGKST